MELFLVSIFKIGMERTAHDLGRASDSAGLAPIYYSLQHDSVSLAQSAQGREPNEENRFGSRWATSFRDGDLEHLCGGGLPIGHHLPVHPAAEW